MCEQQARKQQAARAARFVPLYAEVSEDFSKDVGGAVEVIEASDFGRKIVGRAIAARCAHE